MVACDLCKKEFKNSQGLRGHRNFVHSKAKIDVQAKLEDPGHPYEKDSTTPVDPLSILDKRVSILEQYTEMPKTHPLLEKLGVHPPSINSRLNQYTEQLGNLSEQLHTQSARLNDIDIRDTHYTDQLKQVTDSHQDHNKSMDILRQHLALLQRGLENSGTTINALEEKVKKLIDLAAGLEERLKHSEDNTARLTTKIDLLELKVAQKETRIKRLELLVQRVPTGQIVDVEYGRDQGRRFIEYKTKFGLTRPYKHSTDLLSGDHWIDLNEPLK